jgi:hypothetical protein
VRRVGILAAGFLLAAACNDHDRAADARAAASEDLPAPFEEVGDEDLTLLLNRMRVLAEVGIDSEARWPVRVIAVAGEAGDAGLPTGEARTRIYIAVSEFAEDPRERLFTVPPMYGPTGHGIRLEEDGTPVVTMRLLEDEGWTPVAVRVTPEGLERVDGYSGPSDEEN